MPKGKPTGAMKMAEDASAVMDPEAFGEDRVSLDDPVSGVGMKPEDLYGDLKDDVSKVKKAAKGQEPADKKGQTTVEDDDQASKKTEKPDWDKNRQALDQEKANRAKAENEVKGLRAELADMQESLNKLQEAAKRPAKKDQDDQPLTDDSDIGAVEKRIQQVAERRTVTAMEEVSKSIEALAKKVETITDEVQGMGDQRALDELVVKLDAKYGEQFRNEALLATNAYAEEKGEGLLTAGEFELALEMQYMKLAQEAKTKKKGSEPKAKAATVDSGTGGSAPRVEVGGGSLDEEVEKMRQEGKFRFSRSGSG